MSKYLIILISIFSINYSHSQVFINEVDADNPGSDNKEFIELKSSVSNFSLNGYVLVFFNGQTGSGLLSYYSIDLDGYVTDQNGIIHFGNSQVTPTPVLPHFPLNTIQNGPDVIALYQANSSDFPIDTAANNNNLIDALAYSTNTTFPTSLMNIFGISVCSIDNQPLNSISKSIQRKNDGTYEVKVPTPGVNNDGSGIILNYLSTSVTPIEITEGEILVINFSTSQPVTNQPLNFSISLNNLNFNENDYTGSTTISIPIGQSTASTQIQILNDSTTEGDEELSVNVISLPTGYSLNNNIIIVRVYDANIIVAPFGTPLSPTYNIVSSAAPTGYYDSIEGLSGSNLKQALQNIIANPNQVRAHSYGDVEQIIKIADQNPANSSQVWLMYVEQPRSKLDYQDSNSNTGKWNREHIYPQSRGGFQNGTSSFADGINIWLPTNSNDILAGHGDAHHIRAEDGPENSLRSNKDYGLDYNGPSGNLGSWKGDVARSLFYMAVRYNGLNLVNGNPQDTTVGEIGDLATLLNWNEIDPKDDFEMNRNNYIYSWQLNRNPFIDHPNLASYIWGENAGLPWSSNLGNKKINDSKVKLYPNPTKNSFTINGIEESGNITIFNSLGLEVFQSNFYPGKMFTIDSSPGIYFVNFKSDATSFTKKLILN